MTKVRFAIVGWRAGKVAKGIQRMPEILCNSEQLQAHRSMLSGFALAWELNPPGRSDCLSLLPVRQVMALSAPLVCPGIPGLSYHTNWLSAMQHDELLLNIDTRGQWKRLHARSLQNHGGLPHARGMVETALPVHLAQIARELVNTGIFAANAPPNHVLVNRYEPGEGIDAHEDGPVFQPRAAIVSLQAPIVMDFYRKKESGRDINPVASIVLEPCSLLRIEGEAYCKYLHAIAPTETDYASDVLLNGLPHGANAFPRMQRTSLTLRRAAKTLKFRL